MPELPEVESVRRMLRPLMVGRKIEEADAADDPLVFRGLKPEDVSRRLIDKTVKDIRRKGKIFWFELEDEILLLHFGMSGWMEVLPDAGKPKFSRLMIRSGNHRFAFTDPRRLGRIWFAKSAQEDPHLKGLGFDALDELPSPKVLYGVVHVRKAPIKAVLLDQGTFAGVGNYLADEVLYQARIAPTRHASTLTDAEVSKLRKKLHEILEKAVEVGADETKFPEDWLFHHRWGGKKGADKIAGKEIVRETVAGRTTAWVPGWQK